MVGLPSFLSVDERRLEHEQFLVFFLALRHLKTVILMQFRVVPKRQTTFLR